MKMRDRNQPMITIDSEQHLSSSERPYHHGDLAPTLRQAARAILEEEGLAALSLRSVARRAGVSHAAPYRHYASREALLADVAAEGLEELRGELIQAGAAPADRADRIDPVSSIGGSSASLNELSTQFFEPFRRDVGQQGFTTGVMAVGRGMGHAGAPRNGA